MLDQPLRWITDSGLTGTEVSAIPPDVGKLGFYGPQGLIARVESPDEVRWQVFVSERTGAKLRVTRVFKNGMYAFLFPCAPGLIQCWKDGHEECGPDGWCIPVARFGRLITEDAIPEAVTVG